MASPRRRGILAPGSDSPRGNAMRRRFACEALESRDLPPTLPVIATGAATVPDWALALAAAVAARSGHPLSEAQLTGSVATYDAGQDTFTPPVEHTAVVL